MAYMHKLAARLALMRDRRALLLPVALLAACMGQETRVMGPKSPNPVITQVVIAPESLTLDPAQTALFRAYGRTADGDSVAATVVWSASLGSMTSDGWYTADTSATDDIITATLSGSTLSATGHVHKRRVVQVVLSPAAVMLPTGGSQQFAAYGIRNTGDTVAINVSWSATGGQVTGGGLFTAGTMPGAYRVIATLAGGGPADTSAVTIVLVPVATVAVSPATATTVVGRTVQLTATPRDSAGNPLTGRNVTWSSSAPAIATVSASGLVTGRAAGAATITATVDGVPGTASVTITSVPVATVAVSPATATVLIGATVQLSATAKDSAGNTLTGRTVTWSSSAPTVASVSTDGLVTGQAAGNATLTATIDGVAGTSVVTVKVVPVATVAVSPATATVFIGATVQLSATAKDSVGNTLTGRTVMWSSSAPTVASVSPTGLVKGLVAGTATITATIDGVAGTSVVTVKVVPVVAVVVSPAPASVVVGNTVQLNATAKDSVGNTLTGRTVTWSSSAPTVASVSATGLVKGLVAGTATITATIDGIAGTSVVTVTPPDAHVGYYVAVTGSSSGDGSSGRPWDLQTALAGGNGKVQPGDTIWLRGGTYTGAFSSSLSGTATAPIVVRQYPGERAIIDRAGTTSPEILTVSGSWTVFWGFEIMNSTLTRTSTRKTGVYVLSGTNIKLVNLVIHDVGMGVFAEPTTNGLEIYGTIVYNEGWQDATRSNGHAFYLKQNAGGSKLIQDNVMFNAFGFGVHVYADAGTGDLRNMTFDGNVAFNNGTLSTYASRNIQIGGENIADGDVLTDNMTYSSPGVTYGNVRIGYLTLLNGGVTLRGNTFVGGTPLLDVGYWQGAVFQNNLLVGTSSMDQLHDPSTGGQQWSGNLYRRDPTATAWMYNGSSFTFSGWQSATGLGATDQAVSGTPSVTQVFVRPNRYEPGRATVVVYNWGNQGSVAVDLSGVVAVGSRYEVRNVQDIFGTPVASGTFGGGTIAIPMGGVTPPAPIGGSPVAPLKTGPAFDVFMVTSAP